MKKELIHKYLSGTCTSEEKSIVEKWLSESPKNEQIMEEFKQIWGVTSGKKIDVDSFQAWDSFRERHLDDDIGSHGRGKMKLEPSQDNKFQHKEVARRGSYSRIITYTVAAAAVLIIALLFYSNTSTAPTQATKPELVSQEITTERGQRTTVRLSDGTRIHLNAESKLSVPQNYMVDSVRVVKLEGEAFFEVVSNKEKPFVVHTEKSVTRVLGTKFNISAYPDEEQVQVVVKEGKVALGAGEELQAPEVQLTRNQKGTISNNGNIVASNVSDVGMYIDWSKGQLRFRDTPLDEVEKKLERWYDVEVILQDKINTRSRHLTGSFEDVSMTSVLNSIALSLELNYTQDGRKIIFQNR